MKLYYHPLFTDALDPRARFPRERYRLVCEAIERDPRPHGVEICEAPLATRQDLEGVHDASYVDAFLEGRLDRVRERKIGMRPWTPLIVERTMRIMGASLAALNEAMLSQGVASVMAGGTHHAFTDSGAGYCVFNDLVLCAHHARRRHHGVRVGILDMDVHQGDGTAAMLAGEPWAMTLSVHCEANFPFRKELSDWDLGLPAGASDDVYLDALEAALEELDSFRPDLLLFQAGVDALETDGLGKMSVTRRGMWLRNDRVFEWTRERKVPVVVFMGGGYSKPILHSVEAFHDLFVQAAASDAARQRQESITCAEARS